MFILGMFWKRTTGTAAVAGLVTGFALSVFFNNYAIGMFGNETMLYTAFKNSGGVYEIPFLINMGWSFFFTMVVMITLSLVGKNGHEKAFVLDKSMFKVQPVHLLLIVAILMVLTALYVMLW